MLYKGTLAPGAAACPLSFLRNGTGRGQVAGGNFKGPSRVMA